MDSRAFAVLATDVAVLTIEGNDLKVLLTTAKSASFSGMPVLPGGLVGHIERTDAAAKRILGDVLSDTNFYIEQLSAFDDPKRDPLGRVVSIAYLMLVPWDIAKRVIKKNASWNAVKTLPKLGYDHNEIVKHAVKRLKAKITYTNIIFGLMPAKFSLSDLQKTYETVLETPLDKRNFVKKIKSLKLLTKTGQKIDGEAHRPASLYKFTDRELKVVEVF